MSLAEVIHVDPAPEGRMQVVVEMDAKDAPELGQVLAFTVHTQPATLLAIFLAVGDVIDFGRHGHKRVVARRLVDRYSFRKGESYEVVEVTVEGRVPITYDPVAEIAVVARVCGTCKQTYRTAHATWDDRAECGPCRGPW